MNRIHSCKWESTETNLHENATIKYLSSGKWVLEVRIITNPQQIAGLLMEEFQVQIPINACLFCGEKLSKNKPSRIIGRRKSNE